MPRKVSRMGIMEDNRADRIIDLLERTGLPPAAQDISDLLNRCRAEDVEIAKTLFELLLAAQPTVDMLIAVMEKFPYFWIKCLEGLYERKEQLGQKRLKKLNALVGGLWQRNLLCAAVLTPLDGKFQLKAAQRLCQLCPAPASYSLVLRNVDSKREAMAKLILAGIAEEDFWNQDDLCFIIENVPKYRSKAATELWSSRLANEELCEIMEGYGVELGRQAAERLLEHNPTMHELSIIEKHFPDMSEQLIALREKLSLTKDEAMSLIISLIE